MIKLRSASDTIISNDRIFNTSISNISTTSLYFCVMFTLMQLPSSNHDFMTIYKEDDTTELLKLTINSKFSNTLTGITLGILGTSPDGWTTEAGGSTNFGIDYPILCGFDINFGTNVTVSRYASSTRKWKYKNRDASDISYLGADNFTTLNTLSACDITSTDGRIKFQGANDSIVYLHGLYLGNFEEYELLGVPTNPLASSPDYIVNFAKHNIDGNTAFQDNSKYTNTKQFPNGWTIDVADNYPDKPTYLLVEEDTVEGETISSQHKMDGADTYPGKFQEFTTYSKPKLPLAVMPAYSRTEGYESGPRRYNGRYKPDHAILNPSHPCAKGLIWAFCPVFNDGPNAGPNTDHGFKNLVGNTEHTGGRVWSVLYEGGYEKGSIYLDNPATANDYLYWRLPEYSLYGSGQTTTMVWVWTGTNNNENWLYDTEIQGNSDYLDAMSVGGTLTNPAPTKLYWQDASGTERTLSTSLFDAQEGPRHCFASRILSGVYADIWVDGIQQGIDTNGYTLRTTNPSGGGRITIGMDGQRTTAKAMQNGIYHLGYKWNRVLSDAEMKLMYQQPYALVSPSKRRFHARNISSFTKFAKIRRTYR